MLEILSVFGSLSSIAALLNQRRGQLGFAQNLDIPAQIEAVEDELNDRQRRALSLQGAEEIISLLVIDEDLLRDLTMQIEKCIHSYRMALRGPNRRYRERADRQAERCVCEALNRIRQRNQGTLPPGRFSDWWISYRCLEDNDY
ncbi:MAG: hypothetical protein ABJK59_12625 [Erythrobacter sp.]|uniref:hypothetical protein n=1 Tax=Erythrobacter sp. TaxID=1042 RepID=UPI0032988CD9